jgi:hypothetical protein
MRIAMPDGSNTGHIMESWSPSLCLSAAQCIPLMTEWVIDTVSCQVGQALQIGFGSL